MRKRPLRELDRYLVRQLIPPFLIALGTVMTALLLERLLVLLDDLASEGSSLATFLSLLTDLLPHYLGLAIPAAFSVSIFITIRRMSDHDEIDALMASGISLSRISHSYVLIGILLGGSSLLLYGYIQPLARYDFRSGFYSAAHAAWTPRFQARMFATTTDGAMLTAEKTRANGSVLEKVFIRVNATNDTLHLISAQRGLITTLPSRSETRLDLWNGDIITARHGNMQDLHKTHFEHSARFFVNDPTVHSFRSRGKDARELTLFELIRRLEHSHQIISPSADPDSIPRSHLRAELDFRLAQALTMPFIAPLAATLAMGVKRRRPITGMILLAILLVGFYHLLQFGQSLVATGAVKGFYGVWIPELTFCAVCILLFVTRSQGGWLRPKKVKIPNGVPITR